MCYGEVSCIYQMAAGVAETVFLYFAFTKKKSITEPLRVH